MTNIKVKDLADTSSITTDNQLMVLTNDVSNIVQNISVENFVSNIVSTDSSNGVTVGTDDKLYVDNSDSGVTAGIYQYPQNLEVDSKGKITSVINGTPAAVPIATSSTVGTVKPDNSTITVANDGTLTAVLNNKMNTDLSNMSASQSAKNEVISWSMPDYDNGISFSTSYTAPENGFVSFTLGTYNNQHAYAYIDGVEIADVINGDSVSGVNWVSYVPIEKGSTITFSGGYTTGTGVFYPMKGTY